MPAALLIKIPGMGNEKSCVLLYRGNGSCPVHQASSGQKSQRRLLLLPGKPRFPVRLVRSQKYQRRHNGTCHRVFLKFQKLPGFKDRPVLHGLLHHLPGAAVLILQLLMDLLIPQDCLVLFKSGGHGLQCLSSLFTDNGALPVLIHKKADLCSILQHVSFKQRPGFPCKLGLHTQHQTGHIRKSGIGA